MYKKPHSGPSILGSHSLEHMETAKCPLESFNYMKNTNTAISFFCTRQTKKKKNSSKASRFHRNEGAEHNEKKNETSPSVPILYDWLIWSWRHHHAFLYQVEEKQKRTTYSKLWFLLYIYYVAPCSDEGGEREGGRKGRRDGWKETGRVRSESPVPISWSSR